MTDKQTMHDYLLDRLTKLDTPEECEIFLQDLCTFAEVDNMAQRLYSAKLMLEGKTYSQVIEETQISSATLSHQTRQRGLPHRYRKIIGQSFSFRRIRSFRTRGFLYLFLLYLLRL